jgi:hypothetical protein
MPLWSAIAVILPVPVTTVPAEIPVAANIVLAATIAAGNPDEWACLYRQVHFPSFSIIPHSCYNKIHTIANRNSYTLQYFVLKNLLKQ